MEDLTIEGCEVDKKFLYGGAAKGESKEQPDMAWEDFHSTESTLSLSRLKAGVKEADKPISVASSGDASGGCCTLS